MCSAPSKAVRGKKKKVTPSKSSQKARKTAEEEVGVAEGVDNHELGSL